MLAALQKIKQGKVVLNSCGRTTKAARTVDAASDGGHKPAPNRRRTVAHRLPHLCCCADCRVGHTPGPRSGHGRRRPPRSTCRTTMIGKSGGNTYGSAMRATPQDLKSLACTEFTSIAQARLWEQDPTACLWTNKTPSTTPIHTRSPDNLSPPA